MGPGGHAPRLSGSVQRVLSRFVDDLPRDLSLAVRSLSATFVATLLAVLSLAMGANTAIFSAACSTASRRAIPPL